MMPVSHFLISWGAANTVNLNKRERMAVTLAGVAPDIDGFGIIAELLTKNTGHPLYWWSNYHHVIAHNILFGIITAVVCFSVAKRRFKTALMALATFHIHLLCDVLGAKGPDGSQWPIPYLLPFSKVWQWAWEGQWLLNAWQNVVITAVALAFTFYLAWRRGFSPLEIFSKKADRVFVNTLRNRFPRLETSSQRGF